MFQLKYVSTMGWMLLILIVSACKPSLTVVKQNLTVLSVRVCVIEGSADAFGKPAGSLVSTNKTILNNFFRVSEIWEPASISFIPLVITNEKGIKGVPVIRDPFVGDRENKGDIDVQSGSAQPVFAAAACNDQWNTMDQNAEGIIVVIARDFINGIAQAVASSPKKSLWVAQASPLTGKRGDDMCGEPRQLVRNDVFNLDPSNGSGQGWLVLQEEGQYDNTDHLIRSLAHELGHVLFLGHGNGLDDNLDGLLTGPGSRRFDHYCDPLGLASNGKPNEDTNGCSLMGQSAACTTITPLQVEMARSVAQLLPGCSGACAAP